MCGMFSVCHLLSATEILFIASTYVLSTPPIYFSNSSKTFGLHTSCINHLPFGLLTFLIAMHRPSIGPQGLMCVMDVIMVTSLRILCQFVRRFQLVFTIIAFAAFIYLWRFYVLHIGTLLYLLLHKIRSCFRVDPCANVYKPCMFRLLSLFSLFLWGNIVPALPSVVCIQMHSDLFMRFVFRLGSISSFGRKDLLCAVAVPIHCTPLLANPYTSCVLV